MNADGAMSLLNAFSGGVFLAAGLAHILPHVIESAAEVDHGRAVQLHLALTMDRPRLLSKLETKI